MTQSIYFIRCKRNDKYYIGRSNNPERRFKDHMSIPNNELIRAEVNIYNYENILLDRNGKEIK